MSWHQNPEPVRYVAKIGDQTHSLEVLDGRVTIDGEEVDASMEPAGPGGFSLFVEHVSARVLLEPVGPHRYLVTVNGEVCEVELVGEHDLLLQRLGMNDAKITGDLRVRAPMPGLVRAVHVEEGDAVEAGTPLLVLEAMKMENEVRADHAATVRSIRIRAGDSVEKDQLLVELGAD